MKIVMKLLIIMDITGSRWYSCHSFKVAVTDSTISFDCEKFPFDRSEFRPMKSSAQ